MRLDCITQQLNMGTRAGTCRLAAESRRLPRHRSRLAEGGRNNIKKSNVKWLTPLSGRRHHSSKAGREATGVLSDPANAMQASKNQADISFPRLTWDRGSGGVQRESQTRKHVEKPACWAGGRTKADAKAGMCTQPVQPQIWGIGESAVAAAGNDGLEGVGLRVFVIFPRFAVFGDHLLGLAWGVSIPRTSNNGVFADAVAFNKKMKVLFLGIGTAEGPGTKTFSEQLSQAGIKNAYFESSGTAHEWLTWRRCLNDFAPRLFK